jgi:hypothetical protein
MNSTRTLRQAIEQADRIILRTSYRLGGREWEYSEVISANEASRLAGGAMANVLDEVGEVAFGLHGTGWHYEPNAAGLRILTLGR